MYIYIYMYVYIYIYIFFLHKPRDPLRCGWQTIVGSVAGKVLPDRGSEFVCFHFLTLQKEALVSAHVRDKSVTLERLYHACSKCSTHCWWVLFEYHGLPLTLGVGANCCAEDLE